MVSRFAIFDLDRTITTFGTFTPFLLGSRKGASARASLFAAFLPNMMAYKCGLMNRRALKDKMLSAALSGISRKQINHLSQTFVTKTLATGARPKAIEAITRHKSKGDCLVLATASVDFYASIFASQLGFDICVATGTNYLEDSETPLKVVGSNCYGADKVEMIMAALSKRTSQPRDEQHWTFYSDHHSDFGMFELADAPYVISPAARTRREAINQNLPILDW